MPDYLFPACEAAGGGGVCQRIIPTGISCSLHLNLGRLRFSSEMIKRSYRSLTPFFDVPVRRTYIRRSPDRLLPEFEYAWETLGWRDVQRLPHLINVHFGSDKVREFASRVSEARALNRSSLSRLRLSKIREDIAFFLIGSSHYGLKSLPNGLC